MKQAILLFPVIFILLMSVSFSCMQKSAATPDPMKSMDMDELIPLLGKGEITASSARKRIMGFGKEAIPSLIDAMQNGRTGKIRAEAITLLGKLKAQEAVPKLIEEIEKKNSLVRSYAIKAAGEIGDDRVIEPLASVVVSSDYLNRQNAIDSLIVLGEKGKNRLSEIVLSNICGQEYIIAQKLIESGWDPKSKRDKTFINIAANNIDYIKYSDQETVSFLIETILQCDNYNRKAYEILAYLNCDECFLSVINTIEKHYKGSLGGYFLSAFGSSRMNQIYQIFKTTKSENLREICFYALNDLRDNRIFDDAVSYLKSNDSNLLYTALEVIKRVNKKESVQYIAPLLDKRFLYREEILNILDSLKEPSSVPAIVNFVKGGGYSNEIKEALYILGEIGDIKAADSLYSYTNHPLEDIRIVAYSALLKLNLKKRQDLLVKLLLADDLDVRAAAYKSLKNIKWIPKTDYEKAAECLVSQHYSKCRKCKNILSSMLIYDLESLNKKIQMKAFEGLEVIKDDTTMKVITSFLDNNDFSTRIKAAQLLQKLNWIPGDDENKIKYYFYTNQISQCLRMGDKAILFLIDLLINAKKNNFNLVINNLQNLITSNTDYWLPLLLEKYSTEYNLNNPFFRSFILDAWEENVNIISVFLNNDNPHTRKGAITVLGESMNPSAVWPLIKQLGMNESDDILITEALEKIVKTEINEIAEILKSPIQNNKNLIINALPCSSEKIMYDIINKYSDDKNPIISESAHNWLKKCYSIQNEQKEISDNRVQINKEIIESTIQDKLTEYETLEIKLFSDSIFPSDFPLLSKYSLYFLLHHNYRQRYKAVDQLNKYNWKPKSFEEEIALYFAMRRWDVLLSMGEDALPYLLKHFKNGLEDSSEFLNVLLMLGWEPESIDDIIKNAIIRHDETSLLNIKEDIFPLIKIYFLNTKNDYDLSFIINVMGQMKDNRAVDLLLYTYNWSSSYSINKEAIEALKNITSKQYNTQKEWQIWWEAEKTQSK